MSDLDKLKAALNKRPILSTPKAPTFGQATFTIGNSFVRLNGFPGVALEAIAKVLTYTDEAVKKERARLFMQMSQAKARNMRKYYFAMKAQLDELPPDQVCWLKDNTIPTGHLDLAVNALAAIKFTAFKLVDKRIIPQPYLSLRWENRPFSMRYYQDEMVALAQQNNRGVYVAAVGSGKSRVFTQLVKDFEVNTLILVPSLALVEQTYRILYKAFGAKNVQILKSATVKSPKALKPIRIANVQTIAAIHKKGMIDKVLADVDMLMIDEFHHSGAKTYMDLLHLTDHIYYRYGFTGTFVRNDSKTLDMHGFLSNVLYEYPPFKATQEGYLTPVTYVGHVLPGIPSKNYQKEFDKNFCGNAKMMTRIVEIIKTSPQDDQILILINRKDKSGVLIHEHLKKLGFDNLYVSGDNKKEDIANAIEAFNDKKVRLLVGSTVIGEGVDIHSTNQLILATGGKSEVQFVQAAGRAVRLSPGKTEAKIHDFMFKDTWYMEKHFKKRHAIFKQHFSGTVEWR